MPELKDSHDEVEPSTPAKPLASWYAQGLSDGLGDRLLMFDNTGAPSLELLRFRRDFADVPGFEAALRERVERLDGFQHPAFAQVRSVQRLEPDDDLALVSNSTPGKRLSEVLHQARGPEFAATLIRQLAPALALLQKQGSGIGHGLLTPERIMVSPEGRLTILEHVVGPAIDTLNLSGEQLASLGVRTPSTADSTRPRLDPAADWYQLGLLAVSVLIGRTVTASELPHVAKMLDGPELSPLVRQWLHRALQISGPAIESGADACAVLDEWHQPEEPAHSVPALPSQEETVARRSAPRLDSVDSFPVEPAVEASASSSSIFGLSSPSAPGKSVRSPRARAEPPPVTPPAKLAKPPVVASPPAETRKRSSDPARPRMAVRARISTGLIAVFASIALAEAGIIAALSRALWLAQNPAIAVTAAGPPGELLVSSRSAEAAPLRLTVAPDLSWVRVRSASSDGVLGDKAAAAAQPTGTMQISSPIPLKVFEQSRLLGTMPGADLILKAGPHDIELVNLAAGYRVRQAVQIEAGQTLTIHVAPPHGWLTAYATPDADVLIDGERVGRTPLGPLPLALGEHHVTFYHPSGAGDRQRVNVTSGTTVRVIGNPRR
jgi:hypothetical protein